MRKLLVGLVLALTLLLALAILAFAQDGTIGQFQPFSINIQHEEPVTVTSTTMTAAGEAITVTTPLTLNVAVRIDVTGPDIVEVVSDGATASSVELFVAEPEPAPDGSGGFVDSSGHIYTVEAPDGVTVGQIQSKESFIGTEVFGRLTNDTDATLRFVQITVQFFDNAGTLLGVDTGFANLDEVASGQSSPFQVQSLVDYSDVAGYAVQVEP
ncbi:MAG: hypothetical protein H3C34_03330 [Caldilineaceae bacterium]|nr:hypothetical protein [Caldilineaceae bacterium]